MCVCARARVCVCVRVGDTCVIRVIRLNFEFWRVRVLRDVVVVKLTGIYMTVSVIRLSALFLRTLRALKHKFPSI